MRRGTAVVGVIAVIAALLLAPIASAGHGGGSIAVTLTAPTSGQTITGSTTFSVSITSTYPIAHVDYVVDGHVVGTATSAPWSYTWSSSAVPDGTHQVYARAYDTRRRNAASSTVVVSTRNSAPDTTITSHPDSSTFSTDATFSFTSNESNVHFQCSLDGGAAAACTSPTSYTGLAAGGHTFTVAAVDQYGIVDPSPANFSWTIQASQSLVPNGDFEGTLQGWGGLNANLSLANDGTSGPGAAVVAWNGSSTSYSIVSAWNARPVSAATLGDTYVTSAYVRSNTPGKTVCLTVREWQNTWTWIGSSSRCITTTSSWQEVGPLYFSPTLANDGLDVAVGQKGATAGDSFELDGVRMQELTPVPQAQPSDPAILAAGDIAGCYVNSDEQTAALVQSMPWATVLPLGDNAYPDGGQAAYNCYDQTWGRFKNRTHPTVGNHDYDTPNASVYYGYFGAAAGDPSKGYYSYDLGTWHVIVLNSNCSKIGGCWSYSPEETWLREDLKAHPAECTLAVMHHPVWTSVQITNDGPLTALWKDLANAHVDLLLNGHAHVYERFAPMDANGNPSATGTREITVGTGGADTMSFGSTLLPTSQAHAAGVFGVLEVILHPGSYEWDFIPVLGQTFTDSGTTSCH